MAERNQTQSYHDALGGVQRALEGRTQAHRSLPVLATYAPPGADAHAAEAMAWQQSAGERAGGPEDAETQTALEKHLVFLLLQSNARQAQQGAAAAMELSMRHRVAPPPPPLPGARDAVPDVHHRQPPGHNIHQQPPIVPRPSGQDAASERSGGSHRRWQQKQQQQERFQDHGNAHAFPYIPSSSAQCPMLQNPDAHGMFSLDALPPQDELDQPWQKYVPNTQNFQPPTQMNGTYSMPGAVPMPWPRMDPQPPQSDNSLVSRPPMVHQNFGYSQQAVSSSMGFSGSPFPVNTSSSQPGGQAQTEAMAAVISAPQDATLMQTSNDMGSMWMPRDSISNVDLSSTYAQPDGRSGNRQSACQMWMGQDSLSGPAAVMGSNHTVQTNMGIEEDPFNRVLQGGFMPCNVGSEVPCNVLSSMPSDQMNTDLVPMSQLQPPYSSAFQQNQMTMRPETTVASYRQNPDVNVPEGTIPPLPNMWLPPLPGDDDMGACGAVVGMNNLSNSAVVAHPDVISHAPPAFGGWHNSLSENGLPTMNDGHNSAMYHNPAGDVVQGARLNHDHHQHLETHAPAGRSSAAVVSAPAHPVRTSEHDAADLALVQSAFQLMSEEGKGKQTKKRRSKSAELKQNKRSMVAAPPPEMYPQASAAANGQQLRQEAVTAIITQLDQHLSGNCIQKAMLLRHLKQRTDATNKEVMETGNGAHAGQVKGRKYGGRGRGGRGGKALGRGTDRKDIAARENELKSQVLLPPPQPPSSLPPHSLVGVDAGNGGGNSIPVMTGMANVPAVVAESDISAPPMRDIASIIEGMGGFKPASGFVGSMIGEVNAAEQSPQLGADSSLCGQAKRAGSDAVDQAGDALQNISAGAGAAHGKGPQIMGKGKARKKGKSGPISLAEILVAARNPGGGALGARLASDAATPDAGGSSVSSAFQHTTPLAKMMGDTSSGCTNARAEVPKIKPERRVTSGASSASRQGAHSGSGHKETSAVVKHVKHSLLRPMRWCGFSGKNTDEGKEEKKDQKGLPAGADGQPSVLTQACMVVILYDLHRNLTLRLDDWGVSYMLGRLAEGNKGTRWTLLETGSWVSPGCWYSMSGENRLVLDPNEDAQDGAPGSLRKWKEQRKNVDLGHFEERRREVFCSPNVGEEKGCVYRLTDQQLMQAVCGQQIRVLNWQTPSVLDALRWVPVEQGTWEIRDDHHFRWASMLEQGHRFEPLDLDSDLGRQQLALAAGKDTAKNVKKPRQEQGGNEDMKKVANGLVLKAGKTAVLGKAGVARVGSSASGPVWREGERGRLSAAVDKDPRSASPVLDNVRGVSAQVCSKKLLKVGQRAYQREVEAEARQDGVYDGKGDTSPGDHAAGAPTSQGGEHKAQSKKGERAKCCVPEDAPLSASRPKRKRTGAPAVESEEASREARKLARQKREQEKKELARQLEKQGLCLVEIPADGHCLFSAINDQLKRSNSITDRQHTYKTLRRCAAKYMLENKEHFRDFLSLENDTFEAYCARIGRTSTWGGQHEIIALCHVLRRNIEVFRHDMTKQCFPDPETDCRAPYKGPPLRVSYHMHEYLGGEHYNSIVEANDLGKPARALRGRNREEETSDTARAAHPAAPSMSDDSSNSDDSENKHRQAGKDDDEVWDPGKKMSKKSSSGKQSDSRRSGEPRPVSSKSPVDNGAQ